MSTANFTVINASRVYALDLSDCEDSIDVKDRLSCLQAYAKEKFPDIHSCMEMKDTGLCFLYRDFCEEFGKGEDQISISLEIVVRDGYYEGSNIDFNLKAENTYDDVDLKNNSIEDMADYLADCFVDDTDAYNNRGLRICHKKHFKAFCERQIEEAYNYAEKVCETLADKKLRCIGHFSNGSAVYEEEKE